MKHFWFRQPLAQNVKPLRIVSLVPSQTELLYDLGLEKEVVGITKFCLHPTFWRQEKTIIGGTKAIHRSKIKALAPDLIIGNKEENTLEMMEELKNIAPIFISDIFNLEDALSMIINIGKITHTHDRSHQIAEAIDLKFKRLISIQNERKLKTAYFIWRKPWMVVGSHNFIHELFPFLHLKNAFETIARYPEIKWEDPIWKEVELILLSSEPFPFSQQHVEEIQKLVPHAQILLVDGEMFSWYGSRLLKTPDYFNSLKELIIYS